MPLPKPKAPSTPRTPKGRLKRGSYLRSKLGGTDAKAAIAQEESTRLAVVEAVVEAAASPWQPITADAPTVGTRVVISYSKPDGKRLYQIGIWGRMVVQSSDADLWMRVPDATPQTLP
jgi:hypothetical protein